MWSVKYSVKQIPIRWSKYPWSIGAVYERSKMVEFVDGVCQGSKSSVHPSKTYLIHSLLGGGTFCACVYCLRVLFPAV